MLHIDPSRIRPWFGDPPRVAPPELPGYRQVAHERFDIVRGSVAGFILMPFWAILFSLAIAALGGPFDYTAEFTLLNVILSVLIVSIPLPIIHEAIHGVAAILCGAKPSYGIGPGFAYTTFREPIPRNNYLAIGLAPLIIISVTCILLAAAFEGIAGWLLFFATINAGGAIGDLWMSWRIVQQSRAAVFFDLADGFAVLVPDGSQ